MSLDILPVLSYLFLSDKKWYVVRKDSRKVHRETYSVSKSCNLCFGLFLFLLYFFKFLLGNNSVWLNTEQFVHLKILIYFLAQKEYLYNKCFF